MCSNRTSIDSLETESKRLEAIQFIKNMEEKVNEKWLLVAEKIDLPDLKANVVVTDEKLLEELPMDKLHQKCIDLKYLMQQAEELNVLSKAAGYEDRSKIINDERRKTNEFIQEDTKYKKARRTGQNLNQEVRQ